MIARSVFALAVPVVTALSLFISGAAAGEADVVDVQIQKLENGAYRFDVTVSHKDEGWEHYADKWVVADADGNILGERVLLHPHVHEQPFTRALSGIKIPDSLDTVFVMAHDTIHDWGGKVIEVAVPR